MRFASGDMRKMARRALLAVVLAGVVLAGVAATASATVRSGSGCDRVCVMAERVLALPQHKPADVNLFSSQIVVTGVPLPNTGIYPQGSAMKPDAAPIPNQAQTRAQLKAFLEQQLGNDTAKVAQALSLYDSAAVKHKISEPTLRAAFAAMTGTSFEPTISYFLHSGKFTTITYDPHDSYTNITYTDFDLKTPTKKHIYANTKYAHEPFPYLIALLGHEIQHTMALTVAKSDEAFVNYQTGLVYTELLAKHPQLAYLNTELARRTNDYALMFLNSRHPGSAQTALYAPDGLGIYPGSTTDPSKDAWTNFGATGSYASPAPPITRTVLAGILAPGTHIPNPLYYDQQTAKLFDHLQDPRLPPVVRLRVNVLLQAISVPEIARTLHLTTKQAITTFGLAPVLAVIHKGQHKP